MKNPLNRIALLLLATFTGMAVSVHAQNLVANPGFETGDFTGWTLGGNTADSFVTNALPHSGIYAATLGPVGSDGLLSQTLPTTIGQSYTIDFFLDNDSGGGPNDFTAAFGGVSFTLTNAAQFDYTEFSFPVVATSTSSQLQFSFRNDPGFFYLDDVSVSAAVPEPSTFALLSVIGVGVLGWRQWRRRHTA